MRPTKFSMNIEFDSGLLLLFFLIDFQALERVFIRVLNSGASLHPCWDRDELVFTMSVHMLLLKSKYTKKENK